MHFSAFYDCTALRPAIGSLVEQIRRAGATVSLTSQSDHTGAYGGGLHELLPKLDVLICNEDELLAIAHEADFEAALAGGGASGSRAGGVRESSALSARRGVRRGGAGTRGRRRPTSRSG